MDSLVDYTRREWEKIYILLVEYFPQDGVYQGFYDARCSSHNMLLGGVRGTHSRMAVMYICG